MYEILNRDIFKQILDCCQPVNMIDIDIQTGEGQIINKAQTQKLTMLSDEIRFYADDLLQRYELYYRYNYKDRFVKIFTLR